MVEGVALVHIEHDRHSLAEFYQKLRIYRNGGPGPQKEAQRWNSPTITVGVMRPVWRLFGSGGQEYNVIINVTAANEGELLEIFKRMEDLGCHVDGYG